MQDVELIFVAYPEADRAEKALQALNDLDHEKKLRLFNAAVIQKDAQDKTHVKEIQDVDSRRGALAGAIFGGLIGLLGGPVGVVIGAAVGGATGGVTARKIDMGFSDDFLKEIKASMQPSSSGLLLIVEQGWVQQLITALEPFNGKIFRHALRTELISQIRAAQKKGD